MVVKINDIHTLVGVLLLTKHLVLDPTLGMKSLEIR